MGKTISILSDIWSKVIVGVLSTLLLGAISFGVAQLKKVDALERKIETLTQTIENLPTRESQQLSTILHSLEEKTSTSSARIKMLLYVLYDNKVVSKEDRYEIMAAVSTD